LIWQEIWLDLKTELGKLFLAETSIKLIVLKWISSTHWHSSIKYHMYWEEWCISWIVKDQLSLILNKHQLMVTDQVIGPIQNYKLIFWVVSVANLHRWFVVQALSNTFSNANSLKLTGLTPTLAITIFKVVTQNLAYMLILPIKFVAVVLL